jgi:exosome complex RNA-binding protein Rrp4
METTLSEEIYIPGDKICLSNSGQSGYGTYSRDGIIYASLMGRVQVDKEINTNEKSNTSAPTVSIKTFKDNNVVIPSIGSLVISKVILI